MRVWHRPQLPSCGLRKQGPWFATSAQSVLPGVLESPDIREGSRHCPAAPAHWALGHTVRLCSHNDLPGPIRRVEALDLSTKGLIAPQPTLLMFRDTSGSGEAAQATSQGLLLGVLGLRKQIHTCVLLLCRSGHAHGPFEGFVFGWGWGVEGR